MGIIWDFNVRSTFLKKLNAFLVEVASCRVKAAANAKAVSKLDVQCIYTYPSIGKAYQRVMTNYNISEKRSCKKIQQKVL